MKPAYPPGYKKGLDDGNRCGVPGEPILLGHDWFALASLLFNYHRIDKTNVGYKAVDIQELKDDLEDLMDEHEYDNVVRATAERLLGFVEEHQSWTISPGPQVKKLLEGILPSDFDFATGGPERK